VGVVEKCTLCAERLDACRRAGGAALVFGDLKDPNSEIRRVLSARNALRRKPSLGTEPRVFYLT
jgi:molybdopterin-containing oxidoreductase family iron-sulfur binding subunit